MSVASGQTVVPQVAQVPPINGPHVHILFNLKKNMEARIYKKANSHCNTIPHGPSWLVGQCTELMTDGLLLLMLRVDRVRFGSSPHWDGDGDKQQQQW